MRDVGEFSILTADQRANDLSAAHRRSIRWWKACVRSAMLLWAVYMSMGDSSAVLWIGGSCRFLSTGFT